MPTCQQSPLVGIISATVDQVNKLCREFGLTPAARTRIQVPEESSYDRQKWLDEALCADEPVLPSRSMQ